MSLPPTVNLERAMQAAMAEARLAMAEGEFPYGAVIVDTEGNLIAAAQDRVLRDGDPTAHAEIGAVRIAIAARGTDLTGCALVSNVEPCAMCTTAAWWARIDTIAFGLSQAELFKLRPDSMEEPGLSVAQAQDHFKRKMVILPGYMRNETLRIWET